MIIGIFKMRKLELKSPGSNCKTLSILPYSLFWFKFKTSIWVKWWKHRQGWRYFPLFYYLPFDTSSWNPVDIYWVPCKFPGLRHYHNLLFTSQLPLYGRATPVSKLIIVGQKALPPPKSKDYNYILWASTLIPSLSSTIVILCKHYSSLFEITLPQSTNLLLFILALHLNNLIAFYFHGCLSY